MSVLLWTLLLFVSGIIDQSYGEIRFRRDAENPEIVAPEYFLERLLENYGDGSSITVTEIQKLLDDIKNKHHKPETNAKELEQEPGQVKGHGSSEVNGSCATDNDWMSDQECLNNKCLSAENIFEFHGISGDHINASLLYDISPTILYRAQQNTCDDKDVYVKPKASEVWGYGFLCVTVINLCSLMGMVFLPLMQKSFYKKLLMFMVALAVGTLSGSSLLFLIPECFDMGSEDNPLFHDYVWKCTTILGGIYLFFLVERILKNIIDWRKKLAKFDSEESSMDRETDPNYYSPLKKHQEDLSHLDNAPISSLKTRAVHRDESINMSFDVPKSPKSSTMQKSSKSNKKLVQHQSESSNVESRSSGVTFDLGPDEPTSNARSSSAPPVTDQCTCGVSQSTDRCSDKRDQEVHVNFGMMTSNGSAASMGFLPPNSSSAQLLNQDDSVPSTPSESDTSREDIKSVAWMVIFGDGLHNFIDGLSIGAAFAKNVLAGVSVSLAVVCEELPHELGDFAILLNSGMSMRQAMMYNFLSACMCYLGLAVGILVGEMTSGSSWIFALAAGMFLYISLVDMLPEVNHASEEETKLTGHMWRIFFLQNAGLLTGYGIMLLLAVFSDEINFDS